MKIINFFKKIIVQKEDKEIEKINLSQLKNWIENKEIELKEKENKIVQIINKESTFFVKEINQNIIDLKNIDFEKLDANDRVKGLVKQNLKKYLELVEKLIENLNKIDYNNFEEVINTLNTNFINFEKKSIIHYQRASFLIRKELIDIRKNLVNYSKELIEILNKNRNIVSEIKYLNIIKQKCEEHNNFEKTIVEINERISLLNEKQKQLIENKMEINKKIDENKQNKEYLENLNKINQKQLLKEELIENIQKLKQNIDFKNLSNIYHINENKMEIIKKYKENFEFNFLNENGTKIINLINESKLNNSSINEIINKINLIEIKITEIESNIKEDSNKILSNQINKIEEDNINIKKEIEVEFSKIEKLKEYKKEAFDLIIEKLKRFNLILFSN